MEEEVRQEIEPKNSLTFLPHFSGSSVIMLISKEKILTHILTSIIFQSFFFWGGENYLIASVDILPFDFLEGHM